MWMAKFPVPSWYPMWWDQWSTQPLSRLPATHCKFNFNICAKINQSAVGFPPNLYQSKDSNGSRGREEGAPKQVALAQYDGGNCSHHSVHLPHCEFYTSLTYSITDFDPQTHITLQGRGWIVIDGAFEHGVFYQNIVVRGHPLKLIPSTKSDTSAPAFYIPPHHRRIQEESQ